VAPESADFHHLLVVPFRGQEFAIPAALFERLPLLTESGQCCLLLDGEPVPNVNLAAIFGLNCNEDDVSLPKVDGD
jgi:hypothetical protein